MKPPTGPKKQTQFKPNLVHRRRIPKRPKSLAEKSGHTPAYTVRQLFDIVVLYKYHLPIINPFTPLLG